MLDTGANGKGEYPFVPGAARSLGFTEDLACAEYFDKLGTGFVEGPKHEPAFRPTYEIAAILDWQRLLFCIRLGPQPLAHLIRRECALQDGHVCALGESALLE